MYEILKEFFKYLKNINKLCRVKSFHCEEYLIS